MVQIKEQRLFPHNALFWKLVRNERAMVKDKIFSLSERWCLLFVYKWGWEERQEVPK